MYKLWGGDYKILNCFITELKQVAKQKQAYILNVYVDGYWLNKNYKKNVLL
jgi:hypothetical protein